MTPDSYKTIEKSGSARLTVKMSRFLAFAEPVRDPADAKEIIRKYANEYHDARHVCWAYMSGPERNDWQLSDNGEPSGTAGKPIMGQINSRELTDVIVIVVRYFGGIKLGTPGLIAAYKESASLALDEAGVKVCRQMRRADFSFSYIAMDKVMRVVKENEEIEIITRDFDNNCKMTIQFPLDLEEGLSQRLRGAEAQLEKIYPPDSV